MARARKMTSPIDPDPYGSSPEVHNGSILLQRTIDIAPIFVGPAAWIRKLAEALDLDLGGLQIIDQPRGHVAAEKVASPVAGNAGILIVPDLEATQHACEGVNEEEAPCFNASWSRLTEVPRRRLVCVKRSPLPRTSTRASIWST